MKQVEQIESRLYQDIIPVREYITQNSWGQHSNLKPGEYREILNFEIYEGFLKSRRGSAFLRPPVDPEKAGVDFIKQSKVWDIGNEEHLIYYQDNKFYSQRVTPSIFNPSLILDFLGGSFTVGAPGNTSTPEFVLEGGRLYVFHPDGNAVIEYDSGFKGRIMGMVPAKIRTIITYTTPGNIAGEYTYGIEKVYQKDGGDHLATSPNRYKVDRLLANFSNLGYLNPTTLKISVDPTELENDTLWSHVRLWRSKNQASDVTDPLNPIDPQGTEEELYEVALITRAEMLAGTLTAIATSTDNSLPAGNAVVLAGQPGGAATDFEIVDNASDDYLSFFIGADSIDLQPLPASNLGTSHSNRIYIADLGTNLLSDGSTIDEDREGSVFYSNNADSQYGEQFKITNHIPIDLDGQKVTKLISFEKDLIIVKEAKTFRLLNGDVTLRPEKLDPRIGTPDKDFLEFIPSLGICGRTNDYNDFRILGFDFVWRSTFNGIEISKPIRKEMATLVAGQTSFIYINGKLMIGDASGNCYVLNVEQGLGWSKFVYLSDATDQYFTFANNSRAGIVGHVEYPMEIEVEDLDTDVDFTNDPEFEGVAITCQYITHQFRSQDGSDVLEHEWLSVMAKADHTITGIPYVNEVTWPTPDTPKETYFVLNPDLFSDVEKLNDREHRLFIAPEAQGIFLFNRMIGNFLHYQIFTTAPCIFKAQRLHVIVDEDGIAWGDFDPFQILESAESIENIIETGTATETYTETGSATTDILEGM